MTGLVSWKVVAVRELLEHSLHRDGWGWCRSFGRSRFPLGGPAFFGTGVEAAVFAGAFGAAFAAAFFATAGLVAMLRDLPSSLRPRTDLPCLGQFARNFRVSYRSTFCSSPGSALSGTGADRLGRCPSRSPPAPQAFLYNEVFGMFVDRCVLAGSVREDQETLQTKFTTQAPELVWGFRCQGDF